MVFLGWQSISVKGRNSKKCGFSKTRGRNRDESGGSDRRNGEITRGILGKIPDSSHFVMARVVT